MNKPWGLP